MTNNTSYVNLDEARQKNLTWVDEQGRFGMKADHWSKVERDAGRGRDSVRIQSHERYFDSLLVLDLVHMPVGCGTWPAFWTIGTGEWPTGGEIDIIEGTNDQGNNQYTVHTTTSCKIPKKNNDDLSGNNEAYSGEARALDCSPVAGCSIDGGEAHTFGPGMNAAGGGFLLTRIKQTAGVSMWWFPRDKGIPQVLLDGKDEIDEKELGQRIAHFPASDQCDLDKSLTEQQLIFNLAMCGGWCASRYPGAAQCQQKYPGKQWEDIIYDHPEEFNDAYWLINSLKVYQPCDECGSGAGEVPPPASSSAQASPSPSAESSSAAPAPSPSAESSSAAPAPSSSTEQAPSPSPSPSTESSSEAQPTPSEQPTSTSQSEEAEPTSATEDESDATGGLEGWTSTWTRPGWTSAWTSPGWTSAWTSRWTSTYTVPGWTSTYTIPAGSLPTDWAGHFNGGLFVRPADGDDSGADGSGGSGGAGGAGSDDRAGTVGKLSGGKCSGQHAMPADEAWDEAYERWADEYQWHYHSQGNRRWKHKVHRGNQSGGDANAESDDKAQLDGGAGADAEGAVAAEPIRRSHRHKPRSWSSARH